MKTFSIVMKLFQQRLAMNLNKFSHVKSSFLLAII